MQVAVVGSGVIGCAVAVNLVERLSDKEIIVTLVSEKLSPSTTSDKSGAIIVPFDVRPPGQKSTGAHEDIANSRIRKWTKGTFQHFDALYNSKDASETNIQLVHGYHAEEGLDPDPWWKVYTPGFRQVTADEIQRFNLPTNFEHMCSYSTYIINCQDYIPWLMKKFVKKGGIIENRKVHNLAELSHYSIVVNCTGLGSAELVNDRSVYPIRGDTVVVKAPWIKQFMIFTNKRQTTYIFPRSNDVLLGGTKLVGEYSEEPNEKTAKEIIERCSTIVPSIRNAEVVDIRCCLRPARPTVRLDLESSQSTPVVHCYGHGGQGIVLHWGCALEVVDIVEKFIETKNKL